MSLTFRSRNEGFAFRLYTSLRWSGAYAPLLALFLMVLLVSGVSRTLLVAWQLERVAATEVWPTIFLHGLRVDAILAGLVVAVPLLLAPLLAHRYSWLFWKRFTVVWAVAMVFMVLFIELATPTFIAQYDVRPNRLFIEYLKYPREVLATLWNGFRIPTLLGSLLAIILAWLASRLLHPWQEETRVPRYRNTLVVWPVVVLAVFMAIRSTTDHRPANPAMFALTSDALVNSLILNSPWSVAFAIYNLKHEADADEGYGTMAAADVLDEVRSSPWLASANFTSEQYPTLHYQSPSVARAKPLNLVIILEESLGATFVESLGGRPMTPNLEALREQGWWFENLYATGTRSVRGIEAVVAGYLPSPARSVVKLSLSQTGFFTLGRLLSDQGYDTGFIYGGEAHFDNMRSFFSGNGFGHIVDQYDFQDPIFAGSWGVSDEDLFERTHQELTRLDADGQPFFRLVFSSSNHSPYEFPDGRVTLVDDEKNTVNNAVRYADHALGKFIREARSSDYWDNTLFLIVADHDSRVYGDDLVPVKNFRIPGLIMGADVEPRRVQTLASQVDLGPTLLSLMGIAGEHPMIGRDLTRDAEGPGRAMMQFNDYYAWMDEDFKVTVLRPNQQPLYGAYDPALGRTTYDDAPAPQASARKALAHALLPLWLYREQRYGLPAQKTLSLAPSLAPSLTNR